MENRNFYNQILTEHNLHPEHKHDLADANLVLEGVNPSCGDDIVLKLKVEDGVITDGAFVGDGCAISQASADITAGPDHRRKERRCPAPGRAVPKDDQRLHYRGGNGGAGRGSGAARCGPHARQKSNALCWVGTPWKKCLTWTSSKTQSSKSQKNKKTGDGSLYRMNEIGDTL